jgi:structural maintenance of chromosome 2
MYILDEVDAALDMSHTQNIGVMIRKYFSQSQFIVVSLKQGMFSNANIIFRTKFVDGTSTVLRTIPAGHELLGRGMEEEEENAGPKGKGGRKAKEDEEEGPKPAKRRGGPLAAV